MAQHPDADDARFLASGLVLWVVFLLGLLFGLF